MRVLLLLEEPVNSRCLNAVVPFLPLQLSLDINALNRRIRGSPEAKALANGKILATIGLETGLCNAPIHFNSSQAMLIRVNSPTYTKV